MASHTNIGVMAMVGLLLGACGGGRAAIQPIQVLEEGLPLHAQSPDSFAVLIGAGDIGECDHPGAALTAAIIDSVLKATTAPIWVFALGDLAYPRGTDRDFRECYDPTWGQFREITRPVSGNHEWKNNQLLGFVPIFGNADPYFAYFSSFPGQVGDPEKGWYRYRHGAWDVYVLETRKKRHIERNSPLWNWLEAELTRPDAAQCIVAYSHYPRFGVGKHGDNEQWLDAWELLSEHGVDIVLAAHEHNYQSYHPQAPRGQPDSAGIRSFVVGTGGGELRDQQGQTAGALRTFTAHDYGVLKLTLHPGRYEWEFIVSDGSVWDAGSSPCQNDRG